MASHEPEVYEARLRRMAAAAQDELCRLGLDHDWGPWIGRPVDQPMPKVAVSSRVAMPSKAEFRVAYERRCINCGHREKR